MKKIVAAGEPFVRTDISRKDATDRMHKTGQTMKVELLEEITDDEKISIYSLGGFEDLCRGPHLPDAGRIKAFKLDQDFGIVLARRPGARGVAAGIRHGVFQREGTRRVH